MKLEVGQDSTTGTAGKSMLRELMCRGQKFRELQRIS